MLILNTLLSRRFRYGLLLEIAEAKSLPNSRTPGIDVRAILN
jgi:hypothetical protein